MRPSLRNLLMSATLTATAALAVGLVPADAWAGPDSEEIWFGTGVDSLEVDENGKLTEEGAKSRTKEVDRIPGEEDWEMRMAARLGKYAAAGPTYTEFYQEVNGQEYIVYRHEDLDYDGSRLYVTTILLEANIGFNKDREYRVQIVQNNGKRDLVLAKGKVKLIDTGREVPGMDDEGGEEEDGEDEDEDGDEEDEEDEYDDDEEEEEDEGGAEGGEGGEGEAPPPVEPSKKGCSVASETGWADVGATGLGILLLAGALGRRRRED